MIDTDPQPMSKPGRDNVTDAVIADLDRRSKVGTIKYGTPLMTFNGRDALVDLYQELLDACCYVKQLLMEGRATDGGK